MDVCGLHTSRGVTQLSPGLGGHIGMLSPSGNDMISVRSRANFFLEPAAIMCSGKKRTALEPLALGVVAVTCMATNGDPEF